ncbi:MAG TPA: M1 family metallopeptidase [Thermoanaerobaculia bacterium]|nr:M1 family metallopeptidase [Thermoanaerobaculia bacterium]
MKLFALLLVLGALPWLIACAEQPRANTSSVPAAPEPQLSAAARDPHSFSRPDEVAVDHLKLDLNVDFDQSQLAGRASLRLANHSGSDRLWLDTRDLTIQKVTLDDGAETRFSLGEPVKFLGRSLEIQIAPTTKWVHIDYATSPEAAALQWLDPQQTSAGNRPFLLTQSQAILARTWVPCQDTPGVRMTYEATVRVPKDLLAVMSAENPTEKNAEGVYSFKMPQRIPSYLLALAVGDLEFRPLGTRSGVYAEPNVAEMAAWELADTPKMIDAAERLYGPYRWGRYDILILPASFPFGGMENPRLTFATPTILARDRSLVALVAHELAHSWSGNQVTNATWNDFWLNEGFTTYVEGRIMEALYGKEYADMLGVLGRQDLSGIVEELGAASPDTHLFLNLAGRDPDEGMSEIAYEKGALFLRMLEKAVGRQRFDPFLRTYFDTHEFQSIDTKRFVDYLKQNLFEGNDARMAELQIDAWIYGPGVPSNEPQIRSTAFEKVEQAIAAFNQGTPPAQLDTKGWTTHHWLHFLRTLPKPLDAQKMAALDEAFEFTTSGNSEILDAWLVLAIQNRYERAYPALEQFLIGIGRRKFLKPLYEELAKTPEGTERALRIYKKARPGYHSVSRATVDEILDWRG